MAAAPNRRAKEQRVALHSLQNAEQCLLMQNYGRAFAHYLLVLKLMPEKKAEIKSNFTLALREWAETLERSGRLEDLFMCYQQACELFPECETMLNNMGAQLFRLGYVDEAACCFRRALKLAPDLLGARENLDNVCGHLVERWHFRMLNDTTRNQHYRQAIHNAIQAGHTTMLDIGTGTALLSLFGVEGGAQHVWGCETSKTMFEVSCDVVSANHMEDRISLIHKISTDMNVPQDLPQKVSLIVTETFDAGLLGESILDTLDHAWKKLLSQNVQSGLKPQVIPSGATVYVCAIESQAIRQNSRCLYPGLRDLDLSSVDMTCPTSSYWLPGGGTSEDWEPYSAERLTTLKGGYRILTEVTETFKFNFNDPKLVEKYRRGMSEFMTLPIIHVGRVDALAVWFDLHLDPQVSLSTCPEAQSCWEQAIFPVLPCHLKHRDPHESFIMKPGDSLEIASGCHDNSLHFQCTAVNRKPKPVSPQWQSNAIAAPKPNTKKNENISYANGLPHTSISPNKNGPLAQKTVGVSLVPLSTVSPKQQEPFKLNPVNNVEICDRGPKTPSPVNNNRLDDLDCVSLFVPEWQKRGGWAATRTVSQNGNCSIKEATNRQSPNTNNGNLSPKSPLSSRGGWFHQQPSPTSPRLAPNGTNITNKLSFDNVLATSPTESVGVRMIPKKLQPSFSNGNKDSDDDEEDDETSAAPQWPYRGWYDMNFTGGRSSAFEFGQPQQLKYSKPLGKLNMMQNGHMADDSEPSERNEAFTLDRQELCRLNDIDVNAVYVNALRSIKNSQYDNKEASLLNLTPGFSALPMQALKLGISKVGIMSDKQINQDLICSIASANDLDVDQLQFGIRGLQDGKSNWDMVMTELVEPCGCLYQQVLEDIALARVTHLKPDGLVMPHNATVWGMVIESDSLLNDSAVINNDKTLGFRIAEFMNDFQMSTHIDIELSTLSYKALTEPFQLLTFQFNEPQTGQVPSYLDQTRSIQLKAVDTGQCTAVVYWFDIWLTPEIRVSTLNSKMHWRQAAVMQKMQPVVSTGTPISIKAICKSSCIDVTVTLV